MPRTYATPARDALEAIGIEQVATWLAQGHGLHRIAAQVGCDPMQVSRWINGDALRSARAEEARVVAAEGFEANAIAVLEEARQEILDRPDISGSIVALARERAQASWRQASVRDRRYREQRTADVTVTHRHDVRELSTAELERLVASEQTLLLDAATGEVRDEGGVQGEAGLPD
jgi:hypothetical protein